MIGLLSVFRKFLSGSGGGPSSFPRPERSKEYEGKNNIAKRVQPRPAPSQKYVMVGGGLRRIDERGQIIHRVGKAAKKAAPDSKPCPYCIKPVYLQSLNRRRDRHPRCFGTSGGVA
ncbi:MAG TPA: hypothetical protein VLC46_16575 [Thermoanaerobaculia bacterium]|jgi:hypothetical protein|nr:hypothetical protein [Thermoanaerobaculia bacterium]